MVARASTFLVSVITNRTWSPAGRKYVFGALVPWGSLASATKV